MMRIDEVFAAIKKAAIARDMDALFYAVNVRENPGVLYPHRYKQIYSYDLRKPGGLMLSPAGELAQEGQLEAADFLREHCDISVKGIIYGGALGGYSQALEDYRVKHGETTQWMVTGLAAGGHIDSLNAYYQQHNIKGPYLENLLIFSAMSGGLDAAQRIHAVQAAPKDDALRSAIACGLARGGRFDELYQYCQTHQCSDMSVLRGLAIYGEIDKINAHLEKMPTDQHTQWQTIFDILGYSLAVSGHVSAVDYYRTVAYRRADDSSQARSDEEKHYHNRFPNAATLGFAAAGNVDRALHYHRFYQAEYKFVIRGLFRWHPVAYALSFCTEPEHFVFAASESGLYGRVDVAMQLYQHDTRLAEQIILSIELSKCTQSLEKYLAKNPQMPHRTLFLNKLKSVGGDASKSMAAMLILAQQNIMQTLREYIATLKSKPISIIDGVTYPGSVRCAILDDTPPDPVRVQGYGPFSLASLLQIPVEDDGGRKNPLRQDLIFYPSQITPDFNARKTIIECNEAYKRAQVAASERAQVAASEREQAAASASATSAARAPTQQ